MLLHLLDLKDIATDYYFFDENCSYELLFLLDAARPEARLTDTMDRVLGHPHGHGPRGPRRGARRQRRVAIFPGPPDPARPLPAVGPRAESSPRRSPTGRSPPGRSSSGPGSDAAKARTLDLAALLTQYRIAKKEMEHKEFQERFHAILSARTRLRPEETAAPLAGPAPPEDGHRSARAHLGGGWRGSDGFLEAGSARRTTTTPTPPTATRRGR